MSNKNRSIKVDTRLTNAIEATDGKPMYDESCKRILANKGILSWIMKECVDEYKNVNVNDIATKYIEGNPSVGVVDVLTGKVIQGLPTEIIGNNNGKTFFDIRYRAIVPKGDEIIELIINIEAQNDQYPGYPLVKRGIFYDCVMITSQYGTEFSTMDYNAIKKVYSIWLCRNVSDKLKNTITAYELRERNIVGKTKEARSNYDLMSVVMINLGRIDEELDSDMLRMLNKLFSEEVKVKEKLEMLENEYGIPASEELEREVVEMCNWSKTVEDTAGKRGFDRGHAVGHAVGHAEGAEKAKIEIAKNFLMLGTSIETVVKASGLTFEEVEKLSH